MVFGFVLTISEEEGGEFEVFSEIWFQLSAANYFSIKSKLH